MKKIFICISLFISLFSVYGQEWMTSFDIAKRLALVQDKMLFVMWEESTTYSFPVILHDEKGNGVITDLFEDEEVAHLIWENFVPVKLNETAYAELIEDIEERRSISYVNKFNDDSIKIMDVNGFILNIDPKDEFNLDLTAFIKKYALNTKFLKGELTVYRSSPSSLSAYNLASKYLDYAIHSEKLLKTEIVKLARIYFDEANWHLSESRDLTNEHREMQTTQIKLMRLKEYLILNRPKKVLRQLKKIEATNNNESINKLIAFLNYTAYKLARDEENANLWKDKVSKVDLIRGNLIVNSNIKN